jgi:hypothetical protein
MNVLTELIHQFAKDRYNIDLKAVTINAAETNLKKAGNVVGFDQILKGFCGRLVCAGQSKVIVELSNYIAV